MKGPPLYQAAGHTATSALRMVVKNTEKEVRAALVDSPRKTAAGTQAVAALYLCLIPMPVEECL